VSPNPWHNITVAECCASSCGEMMTVPSLLRDIACKAVDDERPRTTTRLCKKCEDRESDVVVKNSDGRMVSC